jgi:broad specificity phosphatase PhoE
MQLYVVRHGETAWNKEEVFRGRKDVPLNETGKKQAQLTGQYFLNKGIARIFSSPLGRAMETAEGISKATKIPIEVMDGLNDMNFGAWEGLSLREVDKLYPEELKIWQQSPQKFHARDGESLGGVRRRVTRGIQKALPDGKDPIVLVSHRVICKIIVLYALGEQNRHFWGMRCDPASVSLIEKVGGSMTLSFLNDTCHLHDKDSLSLCRDF